MKIAAKPNLPRGVGLDVSTPSVKQMQLSRCSNISNLGPFDWMLENGRLFKQREELGTL
jgi:hypothetical protein